MGYLFGILNWTPNINEKRQVIAESNMNHALFARVYIYFLEGNDGFK